MQGADTPDIKRLDPKALKRFIVASFIATLTLDMAIIGDAIYENTVNGASLTMPVLAFVALAVMTALTWMLLQKLAPLAGLKAAITEADRNRKAMAASSTMMMVADADFTITFVMPSLQKSLEQSHDYWTRRPKPVDLNKLIGVNIDVFHANPAHNRNMMKGLTAPMAARMAFDGRDFDLTVTPLFDGAAVMGYGVEWIETTAEKRTTARLESLIDAARGGDFQTRADTDGMTEAGRAVAGALHEVYDVVDGYMRGLGDVMGALAQGDLTRRMDTHHSGAFGRVAESVNDTVARLSDMVSQIRDTGESLAQSTAQITSGSVELSSRAESQAASLEETAATMEEMASTIRSNAENAERSASQASDASRKAEEGRGVVNEAVSAMDRIENSAGRIGDITALIDSIAFQTNLLALNASVEAARAGEAGRGFAVVASEVRTLAQRSAEAAREIKDLISESSEHVSQGVDLVKRSGAALDSIATSIVELNESIGGISSASREQSAGVAEITAAVTRMDEVTQQNAGLAEQSANAARELEAQAEELARLVRLFRTEQRSVARAA